MPPSKSLALVGGRVYASPEGPPLDDAVIVIENGTIANVGPRIAVTIPAPTTTIDCSGSLSRRVLQQPGTSLIHVAGATRRRSCGAVDD